jgi:hypothetical protein
VDSKVEAFGTPKIEENQNMIFHLLPNQKGNFEWTNPPRVTTEPTRMLSGLHIICLYFAELRLSAAQANAINRKDNLSALLMEWRRLHGK